MAKLPLSVCFISFNEEANMERTLKSVADIASEIIVVDSHSADKTVQIAEKFGAKVYSEDWKGFEKQKNSALEKCTQPWILSLDCDEVPDETLRHSIVGAVLSGAFSGYVLSRRTFYAGKFLRFSWQPDRRLRLVKASAKPEWRGGDVHEYLHIEGDTGRLEGELQHFSYKDIEDHMHRLIKYARLSAGEYRKKGRKMSFFKLFFSPLGAFLKKYILRLGFLDGFRGFLAAFSSLLYVFLKYVFLWELEMKNRDS
ncbi:MAG: glycosyltransferase family 2 protein [Deferribacterales bacterium]